MIFHGYVSLPEGTMTFPGISPPLVDICVCLRIGYPKLQSIIIFTVSMVICGYTIFSDNPHIIFVGYISQHINIMVGYIKFLIFVG